MSKRYRRAHMSLYRITLLYETIHDETKVYLRTLVQWFDRWIFWWEFDLFCLSYLRLSFGFLLDLLRSIVRSFDYNSAEYYYREINNSDFIEFASNLNVALTELTNLWAFVIHRTPNVANWNALVYYVLRLEFDAYQTLINSVNSGCNVRPKKFDSIRWIWLFEVKSFKSVYSVQR